VVALQHQEAACPTGITTARWAAPRAHQPRECQQLRCRPGRGQRARGLRGSPPPPTLDCRLRSPETGKHHSINTSLGISNCGAPDVSSQPQSDRHGQVRPSRWAYTLSPADDQFSGEPQGNHAEYKAPRSPRRGDVTARAHRLSSGKGKVVVTRPGSQHTPQAIGSAWALRLRPVLRRSARLSGRFVLRRSWPGSSPARWSSPAEEGSRRAKLEGPEVEHPAGCHGSQTIAITPGPCNNRPKV